MKAKGDTLIIEEADIAKMLDIGAAIDDDGRIEILEPKYVKCPDCGQWIKIGDMGDLSLFHCEICKVNHIDMSVCTDDDGEYCKRVIVGYLNGEYRR